MNRKETVAIFGAGIAGMSAAHELAKKGYEVCVYEYSTSCGGQAKSERRSNGLPSEYSWRGYGQFYKNVYEIMQEIPIDKFNTVYDTELSRPIQFILTKDKMSTTHDPLSDAENWTDEVTFLEWIKLGLQFGREITSDKRIDDYAKINAKEWMNSKISSENTKTISSVFAPWIGISSDRLSLHHAANFFRMIRYPDLDKPYIRTDEYGKSWVMDSGSQWSVLRRPSNESWFDPWMHYLMNLYGVKFYFNTKLIKLKENSGIITGAEVLSLKSNRLVTVTADYYVMAVTPFAVDEIVKNSSISIKTDPKMKLFKGLVQEGPHIQVSFRIGFSQKIHLPKVHMAFILVDSEYNITFYFQNDIWHSNVYLGPNIRSLISGTACVSYIPGKLYGKTLTELTRTEFKEEILYQMCKCGNFKAIIRKYNKGKDLQDFAITEFECWSGWSFVDENNNTKIEQKENEKKWVNSTLTNDFMPSIHTSFKNLFLAGAHVKSSVDLYSMETACATGRQAAFYIINEGQKALEVNKPLWADVLSSVDNHLYAINFPNIVDVIIVLIIGLGLILTISLIRKRR